MNIPMGLFLAPISLGTDFVQLFIIPSIAFESTYKVEPALIAIAGCQCPYAKVKGHNALSGHLLLFLLVDKRAVVVSSRIFGNSNFLKLFGWWLRQMRYDIGREFWSPIAASTGRKDDRIALDFQVHRRVAQCKELMPRLKTGKSWFLRSFDYPLQQD